MAVESELAQFKETAGGGAPSPQNPKLLKVEWGIEHVEAWLLVQPSEGRVAGITSASGGDQGSGAGGVLGQVLGR